MVKTDLAGYPIEVGSYLVRPYSMGNSVRIKFVRVTRIDGKGNIWTIGAERGISGWCRDTKEGIVRIPERVLCIPDDHVPAIVARLLSDSD